MIEFSTIGTTADQLKTYVTNYYNTNGLTFLLLVGDGQHIPSVTAGVAGDSDPAYGYILGNDAYSEIFVGRFSGETVADIETHVGKTIIYERDLDTSATWLEYGVGIASDEGAGVGDEGESDAEHIGNIRSDLLNYGYQAIDQIYDPGATAAQFAAALNAGRGIINYCGHGGDFEFVTTGFNVNDAINLINYNMLPFIFDVACVNGNFHGQTCIAEAMVRANNGGKYTGAVGIHASTINQSWAPPMDGEDEMDSILVESYINNIKRTYGGICVSGCMHMNDAYSTGGPDMTDTWTIFGDPSLNIRTKTPQAMLVSHNPTIAIGESQFSVNCNAEDALVALTIEGEIVGTGYISGGITTITLNPQPSTVGTMVVTVTGYNQVTYIGEVLIIVPSGPFVIYDYHAINDSLANNNGSPEYGENILLDLALHNVGVDIASGVTATLSCSDSYISITDNFESYGTINADASLLKNNAFGIIIADNVPDQHTALFNLTVTDSTNIWNSGFSVICNAPLLTIDYLSIDDSGGNGDGALDPGETALLNLNVANNGHAATVVSTCYFSSVSPYVTINNNIIATGIIAQGGSVPVTFSITIDSLTPTGTSVVFVCSDTAGTYFASLTFGESVGLLIEDWESNSFFFFFWENGGNAPWTITSGSPYEGSFAARSGVIGDEQRSELLLTLDVLTNDTISFFKKTSCEFGSQYGEEWDYLEFLIDGSRVGYWDGIGVWTEEHFPVTAGEHTFTWAYVKDVYWTEGEDCAWIDYIVLPAFDNPTAIKFVETRVESACMEVFPNPSSGLTAVKFSIKNNSPVEISIINLLSNEVMSLYKTKNSNERNYTIYFDSRRLLEGIYLCRMQTQQGVVFKKIIIIK
ncbi:MAG: T9SS type A sorting domain-containing protein [Bacteroidia bacterium]|nr:T9SS type A sorting domain-containing protein [Bacteroidia bacterium]